MTSNSQKQSGSVLVILAIIISISLIVGLGFVAMQNLAAPTGDSGQEAAPKQSDVSSESTDPDRRIYANDQFSFNYPAKGWTIGEVRYGEGAPATPQLKSEDYQQAGMGVEKGAIISVNVSESSVSLDEKYNEIQNDADEFGVKDLKKTTVAGMASITYYSSYEGYRHHTIFVHEGKAYDIVYAYNTDASIHMDAYSVVTSSFKFI